MRLISGLDQNDSKHKRVAGMLRAKIYTDPSGRQVASSV